MSLDIDERGLDRPSHVGLKGNLAESLWENLRLVSDERDLAFRSNACTSTGFPNSSYCVRYAPDCFNRPPLRVGQRSWVYCSVNSWMFGFSWMMRVALAIMSSSEDLYILVRVKDSRLGASRRARENSFCKNQNRQVSCANPDDQKNTHDSE